MSIIFFTILFFLPSVVHPLKCFQDDQNALLKIKNHFNNNSILFSDWTPGSDCCKWYGVACKMIPKSNTLRVNQLDVKQARDLVGTIPSTIGDLPYLETLILSYNKLTGPIPYSLTKLKNLGMLELDANQLTGPVPSFLDQLPNLYLIRFSNNQLTGSIPPNLGSMPKLQSIQLSNNKLTGPIPRSLGNVNYYTLELGGNQLTGDASFLFGPKKMNYAYLNLTSNHLSFDLSKVVLPMKNKKSVFVMDLSHNMIYGGVPNWVGQVPDLFDVDLSYNQLCGPIPKMQRKSQGFYSSVFEHNKCLCGAPMPPCKS